MKTLGFILIGLVLFVLAMLLIIVFTGVAIGAACAWLLDLPFRTGWDSVWGWPNWLIAIGWYWLFVVILGGTTGYTANRN